MDAEVSRELTEIESRLHNTLRNLVSDFSKEVQTTIEKLFNKDIDHINEKLKHYQENHKEHYENDKERRRDIDKLNERITAIDIASQTQDKIDEKTDRKKGISTGYVILLCTIVATITGILMFFISK